jgi:hypothetical protein
MKGRKIGKEENTERRKLEWSKSKTHEKINRFMEGEVSKWTDR